MLFIVRGKSSDKDRCLRVNAESAQEAEQIGWKRGLFVTDVEPVEKGSAVSSSLETVVGWAVGAWKATPKNPLRAFGRDVSSGQAAALLMCGCATWVMTLHHFGFAFVTA